MIAKRNSSPRGFEKLPTNQFLHKCSLPQVQVEAAKFTINEVSLDRLKAHQETFMADSQAEGNAYLEGLPTAECQLMDNVLVYSQETRFYLADYHLSRNLDGEQEWRRQQAFRELGLNLRQDYGWSWLFVGMVNHDLEAHLGQALGQTLTEVLSSDIPDLDWLNYDFWRIDSRQAWWAKARTVSDHHLGAARQRFRGRYGEYRLSRRLVMQDITHWLRLMQQALDSPVVYQG